MQNITLLGILNCTPDSFSGDGIYEDVAAAIAHAQQLIEDGAHLIDVGGESTRPGAREVDESEELHRIKEVVRALHDESIPFGIDTTKTKIAKYALENGAQMINSINASDELLGLSREFDVPVVVMHIRGDPETMHHFQEYNNLVEDIKAYLHDRIHTARKYGKLKLILDPGIGFAKNALQNWQVLANTTAFTQLNYPVLIGASRKRFVRDMGIDGTLAAHTMAVLGGATHLRVHDVKEHVHHLAQIRRLTNDQRRALKAKLYRSFATSPT